MIDTVYDLNHLASHLDEAYENNDIDYQLMFATKLIEKALMQIDDAYNNLKTNNLELTAEQLNKIRLLLAEYTLHASDNETIN